MLFTADRAFDSVEEKKGRESCVGAVALPAKCAAGLPREVSFDARTPLPILGAKLAHPSASTRLLMVTNLRPYSWCRLKINKQAV